MSEPLLEAITYSGGAVAALLALAGIIKVATKLIKAILRHRNGGKLDGDKFQDIEERIETLESNDLNHLRKRVDNLEERMRVVEKTIGIINNQLENIEDKLDN